MANDADISTLNSLIKTTIDSVNGFEDAAKHSENDRYTSIFRQFAEDRRRVVTGLQQQVRDLGGTAEDDGSVAAAAHRTFMDLKQAVMSRDDKAIVEEVERGEDHLKEKYETALADTSLSPAARTAVEQAYQSVRAGHDTASQLKHSLANQ